MDICTVKLSHALLDLNFFSALGSTEVIGGRNSLVLRGEPMTTATNNNVLAVWDEDGRPWIKPLNDVDPDDLLVIREFGAKRAVQPPPHSQNNGTFIQKFLPTLMRRK